MALRPPPGPPTSVPSGRAGRRTATALAVATLSLVLAACGGGGAPAAGGGSSAAPAPGGAGGPAGLPAGRPGQGKPAVTLGTKNFSEEFLIGDLYQQALQAKGYTVNLKGNIGGSEVIDGAFSSGQIDFYPEYTGEIVSAIAGDQGRTTSAEETFDKATAFEESQRAATLLPQTPFEDIDVVVVKPEFAAQHQLTGINDLVNVGTAGQGVTFAAQPPARTRYAGLVGLQQAYGLTAVQFVGVDVGVTYSALDTGAANTADAFSTDGQLTTGKYTALADPQHIMGFQHVAPVIKQQVLAAQGPEFAQTLNWVNSLLTQPAILQMNAAIQLNHVDPAVVAQKFLAANGVG